VFVSTNGNDVCLLFYGKIIVNIKHLVSTNKMDLLRQITNLRRQITTYE